LGFADPEKFKAFEQLLAREQSRSTSSRATPTGATPTSVTPNRAAPAAVAPSQSSGMPGWIWPVGLAVIGFLGYRAFSRRNAPAAGGAMTGSTGAAGMAPGNAAAMGGATPYGAGPYANQNAPYGAGVPPGRPGSGMLGTGLAVAGGVAGGMMLDRMLHHGDTPGAAAPSNGAANGLEPGIFDTPQDDGAARQLEERPVDFGRGGDWDAGGGSADVGGFDDGGGDWN
ncbi:MAG: hypothetical protein ABIV63_04740, partial [Caldimonas sp.]